MLLVHWLTLQPFLFYIDNNILLFVKRVLPFIHVPSPADQEGNHTKTLLYIQ